MGYSYLALEELEKATMHVEKAKAYEDAVGQPLVASRFRLEGRIQSRLENLESARQNLEQAGVIYLDLKNYFEAAYTTIELIEVLKAAGKYEEARSYLKTPEIHDFH
jgi:tetratricopeptide (TPR) repeat protein